MRIYRERRIETVCLPELIFRKIHAVPSIIRSYLTLVGVDVVSLTLFDVSFVTINVCRLHKNQSGLHHHHQRNNPCLVFIAIEHTHTYLQENSDAQAFSLPERKSLCSRSSIQVCVYTCTSIILLHFLFFIFLLKLVYKR
jgi:hypothetical protein